jgi:hypothetical protein
VAELAARLSSMNSVFVIAAWRCGGEALGWLGGEISEGRDGAHLRGEERSWSSRG